MALKPCKACGSTCKFHVRCECCNACRVCGVPLTSGDQSEAPAPAAAPRSRRAEAPAETSAFPVH